MDVNGELYAQSHRNMNNYSVFIYYTCGIECSMVVEVLTKLVDVNGYQRPLF